MITQQELKKVVTYNPDTGLFTRPSGRVVDAIAPNGYVRANLMGKMFLFHRMAFLYMTGTMPPQVDHINGVRSDNRWVNLRPADYKINGGNRKRSSRNKTGIGGVQKPSPAGWIRIYLGPKYIGSTKDFFEACCVRRSAENAGGYLIR